jgi:hypothetical protein
MISEELGTNLHDRHTRGYMLSAEEMKQLQTWYAQNDHEDWANAARQEANTNAVAQDQVETVLTQIEVITRRIRKLEKQNAILRQENVALQNDLRRKQTPHLV